MSAEARVAELGLVLPEPQQPVANYVTAVQAGDLLFLSGHGPVRADGTPVLGKVGGDAGRHARSAVGVAELPFDLAIEIEAVVKVFG